jgi:hypothetical protein
MAGAAVSGAAAAAASRFQRKAEPAQVGPFIFCMHTHGSKAHSTSRPLVRFYARQQGVVQPAHALTRFVSGRRAEGR